MIIALIYMKISYSSRRVYVYMNHASLAYMLLVHVYRCAM